MCLMTDQLEGKNLDGDDYGMFVERWKEHRRTATGRKKEKKSNLLREHA